MLLAGSEHLNLPTVEKVQLALCPAGITSGTAALQCMPVVGVKLTVWATVSVFLKTTVSSVVTVTAFGS